MGWDYDLSTGYGRNQFDMHVVHSVYVSLGANSPTKLLRRTARLRAVDEQS
jgi:hypothetical protein